MPLPDYNRPPLGEVVFGVSFNPINSFRVPHNGLYWEKIRDEYPRCEERPPFGPPSREDENWPVPLPRIWFISNDDTHLIQLQNGFFYLNWRKQEVNSTYPRYLNLVRSYIARLEEFMDFLKNEELGEISFTSCELTYINYIEYNHLMPTYADLGNIIPDIAWGEHKFLPNPIPRCKFDFDIPDENLQMYIDVKHGKRTADNSPLYVMDIKTKGIKPIDNLEDLKKWFDNSHEWIVNGFADITSERAQHELWGRL